MRRFTLLLALVSLAATAAADGDTDLPRASGKATTQTKGKARSGGKKGERGPDTGQETLFR